MATLGTKPTLGTLVNPNNAISTGLIRAFLFNEGTGTTVNDSSGQAGHGTLTGTVSWTGIGVDFNGTTILNIGSATDLDNMGPLTFVVWAETDTLGGNNAGILVGKDFSLLRFYVDGTNALHFEVIYSTTNANRFGSSNTISLATLQQYAVTWDGSQTGANITLYVEASPIAGAVQNGVGTRDDSTATMYVGNRSDGTRGFDGRIGLVYLYDRILSGSEIAQLFNDPFAPYTLNTATQRLAPDAIAASTNLTGTVSAIQDDPQAGDANWLTATDPTLGTDLRVTFPTPVGPPILTQEFSYLLRKTAGSGTPTVTVELRQQNVLRATLRTNNPVTSTSEQEFTDGWNASSLVTVLDGSDVELRLIGTPPAAIGATPAFVGAGTGYGSATLPTTHSVARRVGTVAGNLQIVAIQATNTNANANATVGTTGWTAFPGNPYTGTNNRLILYWKIAEAGVDTAGGTISVTGTGGTTTDGLFARIFEFSAADGFAATPVEAIAMTSGTTATGATAISLPSVTPGGLNRRAVAISVVNDDAGNPASATGESGGNWTQAVAEFESISGSGGTIDIQTSDQSAGTNLTGGTVAYGATGDNWVSVAFALVPAGATPNTVEIGAVEWNATYEDTGAVTLATTITATTTVSAALASLGVVVITAIPVTTSVSAGLGVTRPLAAPIRATLDAPRWAPPGWAPSGWMPDGGIITAALGVTELAGLAVTIAATSAVTAALRRTAPLDTSVQALPAVTAVVTAQRRAASLVTAVAAVTPSVQATRPLSAATPVSAAVLPVVNAARPLTTAIQAQTAVAGLLALQADVTLTTTISVSTEVTGQLSRTSGLASLISAAPAVSGVLSVETALAAAVTVTTAVSATPRRQRALATAISVSTALSGFINTGVGVQVIVMPEVEGAIRVIRPLAAAVAAVTHVQPRLAATSIPIRTVVQLPELPRVAALAALPTVIVLENTVEVIVLTPTSAFEPDEIVVLPAVT